MASANPFDLLGDNDNDDPSQVAAVAQPGKVVTPKKAAPSPQKPAAATKLPSKPLPPAQAVKEAGNEGTGRGGGRGGGRGFGRGGRGSSFIRESGNENSFNVASGGGGSGEGGDVLKPLGGRGSYGDRPHGPYRGGRRGGFSNGEAGDEGTGRGGGHGGGRGFGRGGRGSSFNRESGNENSFNVASGGGGSGEERDVSKPSGARGSYGDRPRGPYHGGRRGGFSNGEAGDDERPLRRHFERHSGTGRGYEVKRDGAGRGNWGTATDEIVQDTEELTNANEKVASPEKQPIEEENAGENKNPGIESEEKDPEDKEMTLDEYAKVLEEKRKALQALKTEERKVTLDKDLESMKQLSNKKENLDVFIKLGSDKDKRKEGVDKEEKAKKAVSINEFLKPAEGESYYNTGGRGRGRGRGYRGGYSGGRVGNSVPAPSIMDEGQFPTLGA